MARTRRARTHIHAHRYVHCAQDPVNLSTSRVAKHMHAACPRGRTRVYLLPQTRCKGDETNIGSCLSDTSTLALSACSRGQAAGVQCFEGGCAFCVGTQQVSSGQPVCCPSAGERHMTAVAPRAGGWLATQMLRQGSTGARACVFVRSAEDYTVRLMTNSVNPANATAVAALTEGRVEVWLGEG